MIQRTVYFSNQEDADKWDAIPRGKKATWLHEHLNDKVLIINTRDIQIQNMGDHDRAVGKFPDGQYGIQRTMPGYRFDNAGNIIDDPTYTDMPPTA